MVWGRRKTVILAQLDSIIRLSAPKYSVRVAKVKGVFIVMVRRLCQSRTWFCKLQPDL